MQIGGMDEMESHAARLAGIVGQRNWRGGAAHRLGEAVGEDENENSADGRSACYAAVSSDRDRLRRTSRTSGYKPFQPSK